jgi:hypothetical protein
MLKACVEASRVREDIADIINFALEELVRQRFDRRLLDVALQLQNIAEQEN